MEGIHISKVHEKLLSEGYRGYDPYDALNSRFLRSLPGKWLKIAATQFLVYSPLNVRKLLGIRKEVNPKTVGLVLSSLSELKGKGLEGLVPLLNRNMDQAYSWLVINRRKGYSGPCWGYHFPWQDRDKFIPRFEPSVVVTSIIGHSILDYAARMGNEEAFEFACGISRFIGNDLNVTEDADGICFSYSPHDNNVVHNANVLGGSLLLRIGDLTDDQELIDLGRSSIGFTLAKQNPDGSWYYSIDPITGAGRRQYDFHQGYVIECLRMAGEVLGGSGCREAVRKGTEFYLKTVDNEGRTAYRYPRRWPVDIHNQTQAMITFSKADDQRCLSAMRRVREWTLDRMVDRNGRVAHQVWPIIVNRNEHARWGSAWLMKALSATVGK